MLDLDRLRQELEAACADAGIAVASLVVWVVDAPWAAGTTPLAYLHPEGVVRPGTVRVFRAVGAGRADAFRERAHRLALWRRLPGLPDMALGPMIRHELEHARRWELSGPRFFEADDLLRAAVRAANGVGYLQLPSEREANAATAAYAARRLSPLQLGEFLGTDELAPLLAAEPPPADVVEATVGALERRGTWTAGHADAVRAACRAWDRAAAAAALARDGPRLEVVGPRS